MVGCLKFICLVLSAVCLVVFGLALLSGAIPLLHSSPTTIYGSNDDMLIQSALWLLVLAVGLVFGYLGLKIKAAK